MQILIDLYQQGRINEASNKAENAKEAAEGARWDIKDLQRRCDALTIACQALWEVVRQQTGMKDSALLERMAEIDSRDGKVDGKISATLLPCSRCGRKSNARRKDCLYCGAMLPVTHVFEKSE
jgi:hypothetical protein